VRSFYTDKRTYSTQHSPTCVANRSSASQESSPHFMEPEGSLPYSQQPAICPYPELLRPRPCEMFRNMTLFLRRGVVSISPNHQAGGQPLIYCPQLLIQQIGSYPLYVEAVPPSATWGRAMPWWQRPVYRGFIWHPQYKQETFWAGVVIIKSRAQWSVPQTLLVGDKHRAQC
jgi:hypothetical protein